MSERKVEKIVRILDQIYSLLDDVSDLVETLEESKLAHRASFHRIMGIAIFSVVENGNQQGETILVSDNEVPYVVASLKEKYPGIKIEEV